MNKAKKLSTLNNTDSVPVNVNTLEQLMSKSDAFDKMSKALSDAGFETSTMTHQDQAQMLVTMSLEGVDAEMVARLKNVDAYLNTFKALFTQKLTHVDSVLNELKEGADSVRAVIAEADGENYRLHERMLNAVDKHLNYHEHRFHGVKLHSDVDMEQTNDDDPFEEDITYYKDEKTGAVYRGTSWRKKP